MQPHCVATLASSAVRLFSICADPRCSAVGFPVAFSRSRAITYYGDHVRFPVPPSAVGLQPLCPFVSSLENATGSYGAPSPAIVQRRGPRQACCWLAGVERRQARPKIARYGPEASASEPKGKCRESCDQESTVLPEAGAEPQAKRSERNHFHARLGPLRS
jgi:hypothetical protein